MSRSETQPSAPEAGRPGGYLRATGSPTDRLRRLWHRTIGRDGGRLDQAAHFTYAELQRWTQAVQLAADFASYRTFRRLDGRGRPLRTATVTLRVRPLDGASIALRPGTSDALMLRETFRDKVHTPPPAIEARGVRIILDLGANAGITVAANALRYPDARIVAVELDPENAALARRNTEPWSERCTIIQGAVWTDDGEIPYVREVGNEYGFYVAEDGGSAVTRAISIDTILAQLPDEARVDFLKMDVEGVESKLLAPGASAWAARIDSIALQIHGDYTFDDCARDLERLGFAPHIDRRRNDFITAIRETVG